MLEKPDIQDIKITACLQDGYGLNIVQLAFLPIGADVNTAVYRAVSADAAPYFVKLRSGVFDEMTIRAPRLLYEQGVQQVIPPLPTLFGQLWMDLDGFKLAVFPFVEGSNGYQLDMLDRHWVAFGRALKALHTADIPPAFADRIQRETYSAQWRERVRWIQKRVEETSFADPIAAELAGFIKLKRPVIDRLVSRADSLAAALQSRSQPFVLCHGDIHAANILIDAADQLYLVDWDTLILAPKERDLMFVGGGQFANKRSPQDEEAVFYQGYGPTPVNAATLAYYRHERIVEDIAAYCEQILLSDEGGQDRPNGLRKLTGQFLPGQVVEITFQADRHWDD